MREGEKVAKIYSAKICQRQRVASLGSVLSCCDPYHEPERIISSDGRIPRPCLMQQVGDAAA